MKKAILILSFLFVAAVSFAQKSKDSTATQPQLTDSTEFISVKDLANFDKYLQDKFTVKEYNIIMAGMQQAVSDAAQRWLRKPKTTK